MKTPLATKGLEYLRHPKISKMFTDEMKKKMVKVISLPQEVMKEINQEIEHRDENGATPFHCTICSQFFKKQYFAQRHVKIELGYSQYRLGGPLGPRTVRVSSTAETE